MEILKIIDLLEDKVEQAKSIPLMNRAMVDKEELLSNIEGPARRLMNHPLMSPQKW